MKEPRKGQPNFVAYGFLEMIRFRQARSHSLLVTQSLRHKKPGQYILVLAFATPVPSLTLLKAALRPLLRSMECAAIKTIQAPPRLERVGVDRDMDAILTTKLSGTI